MLCQTKIGFLMYLSSRKPVGHVWDLVIPLYGIPGEPESRSLLVRAFDTLRSLVAMDLPSKMAWILMKLMADADLDEP